MFEKFLNCIQIAGLISISGGTLAIGAITAPTLFKELNRAEASVTMIEIFSKFDKLVLYSAILVFAAKLIELIFIKGFNFNNASGELDLGFICMLLCALGILLISLYLSLILEPQILEAYETSSPIFDSLHHQSELIHKANFLLGLLMLFGFVL